MKNLFYFIMPLLARAQYQSAMLINTIFGTNLGKFGKFNDKELDFDEFERRLMPIDCYRALMKSYLEILDTVFGGYSNSKNFVVPDYWLSLTFVHLINDLEGLKETMILKELPDFDFSDYCNLEVNYEEMIINYPEKKHKTQEYRSKIEQLFYDKCKSEGKLPKIVETDIQYYNQLIQDHQAKRNIQSREQKTNTLIFIKKKSKKRDIFKILEENVNNWVDKKEILRRVRKLSYDAFRSFITQLRKDIKRSGLNEKLQILSDKQGRYKLVVLASI